MRIKQTIISILSRIARSFAHTGDILLLSGNVLISLLFRASLFFSLRRKHHIVIGAGGLVVGLSILVMLVIPGKSRKARAGEREIIEIELPAVGMQYDRTSLSAIPMLPEIGAYVARDLPRAEVQVEEEAFATVSISSHDGIPLTAGAGLYKRQGVMLTDELADFARGLSLYFSRNHLQAMITSGVRTGDRQLDIIKQRIAAYGMTNAFPGLANATVADKGVWSPAWEWLKAHRVPVNPPADYMDDGGNIVGASLHLKGLAIDVVADNLDALKDAIIAYANSGRFAGGLRISGLTRERDCVHIALTN